MLPSSEARPIRVLLVDDSFIVRNGLRASLNPPAFQVVGEAGTGAQGLDQARFSARRDPDGCANA
jgi:DNA-binding NarL/FixJ family response regulator